ncbi:disulfide bond formation protein DsbD [Oceanobacillus picturae]|uniref:disulfide bond formation protein DsbD n=1 Tax=Oceanobacillus picturae TaxID=171693 RepID=UPI00362ADA39
MNKKVFNIIGWILLIGMAINWFVFHYLSWYLLSVPLASICFSISDGSIKKIKKIRKMSISQIILILLSFVLSVCMVYGLIQLANYVINESLHLTGWIKSLSQLIAVIIALYPVKFTFGSIVYKVTSDI